MVILITACGGGDRTDRSLPPVTLGAELVLGSSTSVGGSFVRLSNAIVDRRGRIWVGDAGAGTIYRFEGTGAPIDSIGGWGRGKGSFMVLGNLAPTPNGVGALDYSERTLTTFSLDGDTTDEVPWPFSEEYGVPKRAYQIGKESTGYLLSPSPSVTADRCLLHSFARGVPGHADVLCDPSIADDFDSVFRMVDPGRLVQLDEETLVYASPLATSIELFQIGSAGWHRVGIGEPIGYVKVPHRLLRWGQGDPPAALVTISGSGAQLAAEVRSLTVGLLVDSAGSILHFSAIVDGPYRTYVVDLYTDTGKFITRRRLEGLEPEEVVGASPALRFEGISKTDQIVVVDHLRQRVSTVSPLNFGFDRQVLTPPSGRTTVGVDSIHGGTVALEITAGGEGVGKAIVELWMKPRPDARLNSATPPNGRIVYYDLPSGPYEARAVSPHHRFDSTYSFWLGAGGKESLQFIVQ